MTGKGEFKRSLEREERHDLKARNAGAAARLLDQANAGELMARSTALHMS